VGASEHLFGNSIIRTVTTPKNRSDGNTAWWWDDRENSTWEDTMVTLRGLAPTVAVCEIRNGKRSERSRTETCASIEIG
jgi:hypothetical protein